MFAITIIATHWLYILLPRTTAAEISTCCSRDVYMTLRTPLGALRNVRQRDNVAAVTPEHPARRTGRLRKLCVFDGARWPTCRGLLHGDVVVLRHRQQTPRCN
jgi:hypothetical protein